MFGLCRIPFYSVFDLERFHSTYTVQLCVRVEWTNAVQLCVRVEWTNAFFLEIANNLSYMRSLMMKALQIDQILH